MDNLKPCPFCGSPGVETNAVACSNAECSLSEYRFGIFAEEWNTRPREDELRLFAIVGLLSEATIAQVNVKQLNELGYTTVDEDGTASWTDKAKKLLDWIVDGEV